jgi:ABC-type cobalt transport system substrate-binding protein
MRFGVQSSEFRGQRFESRHIKLLLSFLFAVVLLLSFLPFAFSGEKWPGVDESVVEKYAREHGREASEPLINTDQGDLLLFVFLLAGAVGGFIGGYYWRVLMVEKTPYIKKGEQKIIS